MRGPLQEFQSDTYERPNQLWQCGLSETGGSCPMGPAKGGHCPAASACHPVLEGDRWRCNRSPARGGDCDTGPSPEGVCCNVYKCSPVRSLRALRGRFVLGCLLATLGGICLLMSSSARNEAIVPGELSVHHAQLLERGDATQRCATCHSAGTLGFIELLKQAVAEELQQPTQTSLCLECHGRQFAPEWATAAHNVDPHGLIDASGDSNRRRDPHEPLACAVCHQEHHGASHDLTWMSDSACQACHKRQYNSFAADHPEFEQWPTARRTRIAFDHAAHEFKHFPKEKQPYACATCHALDASGNFQKTLSYEATCANCHDRKIESSWEAGIPLFSLPTLDIDALRTAGHDMGDWPEQATGEFEGAFAPLAKLLLAADESGRASLDKLGADFDFFDLDPDDPAQLQAAADIVWAAKRLMHEVTSQGHASVRARAETVLERKLSLAELADLTSRLSPENLAPIAERWLPNLPAEMGEAGDEIRAPRSVFHPRDLQVARSRIEGGGWMPDDETLSLRYLPGGHADPWVTAWINLFAEAASGKHAALAQPLLEIMMAPTAPGQCGTCHSVDRTAGDRLQVQWYAKRGTAQSALSEGHNHLVSHFTRFSHGPHLLQSQLADCTACHRTRGAANVMESYTGHTPHVFEAGFEGLRKSQCAECHVSGAAGESCLQCHQYHAGGLPSLAHKPPGD